MPNKRKICVITGSRAEYGLLKLTMTAISESHELDLQIIVTGMHLSPDFGNTVREVECDGFDITHRIKILDSDDSPEGLTKSMGLIINQFPQCYENLDPDLILVLGDRFEIFAAVIAAYIAKLPVAHIHGGETTEGALDEAFRHSITKMSHVHFTSTEQYKKRVIQLGEDPNRVFNVGAPGVESIRKLQLLSKAEVEKLIGINLRERNLLVTLHPETLNVSITPTQQLENLLTALSELEDTTIIFTKANADTGGIAINKTIDDYVKQNKSNTVAHSSLGQLKYLSLLKYVDGVVGNSSSGIIEAPSFKIGTLNIGDRQQGRIRSKSIIDCNNTIDGIRSGLSKLYQTNFQESIQSCDNPYDGGDTSKNIINIIKECSLKNILKKQFYDG